MQICCARKFSLSAAEVHIAYSLFISRMIKVVGSGEIFSAHYSHPFAALESAHNAHRAGEIPCVGKAAAPEFYPFPPRLTPCTRVHADKKGHNFWCARLPPKKSVHFHFTHRMISQLRIFYFTYIPQCSPAARCAYSYIRVDSGCLSFKLQTSLLVLLLAPSAHRECA